MAHSFKKVRTLIAGAGTGGLSTFSELQKAGISAVICDGGPLGTTCARAGCMPTKALIEISHSTSKTQKLYKGRLLSTDTEPQFHLANIMKRVRNLRDHFTNSILEQIDSYGDNFVHSHVHFKSPNLGVCENRTHFEFDSAVIATGSSPIIPPSFKDQTGVFTSDTVFDLNEQIDSLDVIGDDIMGLELAQAFSNLGIDVTIYCEDLKFNFLPDEELSEIYLELLKEKMSFVPGFEVHHTGRGKHFQLEDKTHTYQACLLALGRKPNLEILDHRELENALDESGIKIRNLPIYIVGDANGKNQKVHEAVLEGKIAADLILGRTPHKREPVHFRIISTDPQVAILEREDFEGDLSETMISLEDQGRFKLADENYGCIKLFYEPKSEIIRKVYIISSQAEHLAHYIYPYVKNGRSINDLKNSTFYHPTVYETFNHIKEEEMPKHKNNRDIKKQKGKVSDQDTTNSYPKGDIIDQREKSRPRDSI